MMTFKMCRVFSVCMKNVNSSNGFCDLSRLVLMCDNYRLSLKGLYAFVFHFSSKTEYLFIFIIINIKKEEKVVSA